MVGRSRSARSRRRSRSRVGSWCETTSQAVPYFPDIPSASYRIIMNYPSKKTNMFRENSSLDVDSFLKFSFFWGWFSIPSFSRGVIAMTS